MALEPKKKEKTLDSLFSIMDYNPSLLDIKQLVQKHWALTDQSSSTRILCHTPIIFGHRKPKSISDFLCRSDCRLPIKPHKFPLRCYKFLKCRHCPKISKLGMITSTSTNRKYKIPRKITCNASNVIYALECTHCQKQYVGQMKNKILIRINQHLNDIKHQIDTPVSRHFNYHRMI